MNDAQNGLSLFEVLIATLMTSIVILGCVNLQSLLISDVDLAKKRIKGQKIAFQLLDVYPDSISVNLPNGWTSEISRQPYNGHCNFVKVIIQPDLGKIITQERLFCQ